MSGFGQSDISNLVYSDVLKIKPFITVNKKKHERKFNNDMRLLLSEVMFITRYVETDKDPRVIYMGAAPGFHIIKLMKMFPTIKFDLYDNEPLNKELEHYIGENPDQVIFYDEKFNLNTCDRYTDPSENIYLITDHRDPEFMKDPIFPKDEYHNEIKKQFQEMKELSYADDMDFQKKICQKLLPKFAFLRFRPPHFYEGKSPESAIFEYFYGTIWLMIYNDYKSIEARIAVDNFDNDSFKWNYKAYQHRLNHFNDEVRESLLVNPITKDTTPLPNQLGNKFETVMMMQIIKDYMVANNHTSPRIQDLMKFYIDFLVVETCSDAPGVFNNCNIDNCDNEEIQDIDEVTQSNYDDFY